MIFLSLFFMFTSVFVLVKGKLFYDYEVENSNYKIDKAKGKKVEYSNEFGVRAAFTGMFAMTYLVFQIVYIVKATNIDPLVYPTVAYIVYIMLNFAINLSKKKDDLTTEEGRFKYLFKVRQRHSIRGKIHSLLNLAFYGYIFAVLVGLI